MADRGTNFRYRDIRIWNTALTEAELKSMETEDSQPDDPKPPVINPDNPNPFDPVTEETTGTPGTQEKPSDSGTDSTPESGTAPVAPGNVGCASAVGLAPAGIFLLGVLPLLRRKRGKR